ncbi:c-type cytochrome domain-containing protein [Gimesia maris]|uniref:c-type cytochrome domain-containing protein n=1 Tax=Gimesia maris TaxID=122 RepID=UPI00241CD642|nr:c-type cytochrome domain-containing protein [Gimesia maris]|tara:strand:- start:105374 stop:108268 length:2895 start_codon:yes stop_codon:yes gene_type:complete
MTNVPAKLMLFCSLCVLASFSDSLSAAEKQVDYPKQIAPLLRKYCEGCHNVDDPEGKFAIDSYQGLLKGGKHGPAVLPGDSGSSRLIRMIKGEARPVMPPEDSGEKLTEAEIALLVEWVNQGAKGPSGKEPVRMELTVPDIKPSKSVQKPVTSLAWSPQTDQIAVARFEEVKLLSPDLKTVIQSWKGLPGKVNSVRYSPDGEWLITSSGTTGLFGQAAIWDVESGKKLHEFVGHKDVLYAAAISPDRKWLATGSYDQNIILWDIASGKQVRSLTGHNGAIFDLAFSPDSTTLASASADATVKVWQVSTGKRLDTLSQPLKEQYSVTFSPDGNFILAAGADNRIRKWRFISRTSAKINPLIYARFAHENPVTQIAFSPDGKLLASISDDQSLKIWDASQLILLYVQENLPALPTSVVFSPDSSEALVGCNNGLLEKIELPRQLSPSDETQNLTAANNQATAPATQVAKTVTLKEQEPNNQPVDATKLDSSAVVVSGVISSDKPDQPDLDLYRFESKAGQEWLIETNAARKKSKLDSKIEVLDAEGKQIPRVLLRAVRDSYFTFRGKDSNIVNDFRIQNWQEMELNEYLYCNGEVVKLWLYPRGPDSGFNVYPGSGGKRYTYFGTSPITHALHEPCYIVDPHPVGTELPPNGLPVFTIYYENNDDGRRELGDDSRLIFKAPKDGVYYVRVSDVRGFQGKDFHYELTVRPRQPGFKVTLKGANPKVNAGSGKEIEVVADRIDGFNGPIRVDIADVPAGFHVTSPIIIQAGHDRAYGVLSADPVPETSGALVAPLPNDGRYQTVSVTATAKIGDKEVTHPVNPLGQIKLLNKPKLIIRMVTMDTDKLDVAGDNIAEMPDKPIELTIHPGETISARVLLLRNGHQGVVGFGREYAGRNLPHGVYVDNIGLNGLLLLDNQNERTFYLTAAKWVPETTRLFHLRADQDGNQTSIPVLLHVKHKDKLAAKPN